MDFSSSDDSNSHFNVYFEALGLNDEMFNTHGRFKEQVLDVVDFGWALYPRRRHEMVAGVSPVQGPPPMAWRPLFVRDYRSSVVPSANTIARRHDFERRARFKPLGHTNGGTTSRGLQAGPEAYAGNRRCCNRASRMRSQLRGGWKYAYTRA